ncbi:MAG: rRNA maturation RNase YbeY [Oscillospiraceae bacterium]|nr:rRNA maturation RNase YbeY [Oscillospiraceae bacterium]
MHKVRVHITNKQKKSITPDIRDIVRSCAAQVLADEKFHDDAEVNVTFVSDEEIRTLNRSFRDIDRPTDVLSFPLGEGGSYDHDPAHGLAQLGDVVISFDTAVRQANEYGHSIDREVAFLTVHSMLHLLGYDHMNKVDERIMHAKEEKALNTLGIYRGISPVWAVEDLFERLSLRDKTIDLAKKRGVGKEDDTYRITRIACEISETSKPGEWYSCECIILRGGSIIGGYEVRFDTNGDMIDDDVI